ncbi:MAG TPA: class I SAM-dependent methyltransferase [bacterium]|nr:class I SAM-dependent methyltransferase [bacterium]
MADRPDTTALRVALWRYLHLLVDAKPPVLEDEVGYRLAAPPEGWRDRPDMNPQWTAGYRAAIVGRARFVEDLVLERAGKGPAQYVILGAGLDSFVQRHPEMASRLKVYEIDQPGTQAWKRGRLMELGYGVPEWLKLVPVDFEKNGSWPDALKEAGFDAARPTVIASTGVSMYLTKEAVAATLRQAARLAPGSTLAMTFLLTMDLIPEAERAQHQMVYDRARQAGTPFLSFFTPQEMMDLARACGFSEARHVSRDELVRRYFAGRTDGFLPGHGEEFLVATA